MSGTWAMAGGSGVSPYAGSSDLVALGRAVRELRELRGVPQTAVGFDAGVGDFYVGGVERGRLNPTFAVLVRLLRTLRCPPGELVVRYEHHLAAIDPHAGAEIPACPTPESLAHVARFNARMVAWRAAQARRRGR